MKAANFIHILRLRRLKTRSGAAAVLIGTVLLSSCATTHSPNSLVNDTRAIGYKDALKQKDAASRCALFTKLGQDPNFLLAPLAKIHADMDCDPNQAAQSPDDLKALPWLEKIKSEAMFIRAKANADAKPDEYLMALQRRAQFLNRSTEKLELLQQGLTFAQKNQRAEAAQKIQASIYRVAPRLIPQPQKSDYLNVAQDWLNARKFETSRKYFNLVISDSSFSFNDRLQAYKQWRFSYKIEQNKTAYLSAAQKMTKWSELSQNAAAQMDALMVYARALWTEGHDAQAQKILQQIQNQFPSRADDPLMVLGRMLEEKKDFTGALQYYQQAFNAVPTSDNSRQNRARWGIVWMNYKLKNYSAAATQLDQMISSVPTAVNNDSPLAPAKELQDAPRWMFWKAQALQNNSQAAEAERTWADLKNLDPAGYYGSLAHYKLNSAFAPIVRSDNSTLLSKLKLISPERLDWARALIYTNERDVLLELGLYGPFFAQVGLLSPHDRSLLSLEEPDLLYPSDFDEEIQTAAKRFNVDPDFMKSIIRQESAFHPGARSPVDAIGLMQVMPEVARSKQKDTGIEVSHFEQLFDPFINVTIGASLISDLRNKYQDQFILMTASYNASSSAIQNWLNTRWNGDSIEFIEDVPFEETRNYIKLVMRNYVFYHRLQNTPQATVFPADCLNIRFK